jgi:hypothetical protein
MTQQHRPDMANILATVAAFLDDLAPTLQGEARYHARVSSYLLGICQREASSLAPSPDQAAETALAAAIRAGDRDAAWDETLALVLQATENRVAMTRPEQLTAPAGST